MCLSQEYDSERKPGYVGVPLPGISVRLAAQQEADEGEYATLLECTNQDGQIKITKDDILARENVVTGELLVYNFTNLPKKISQQQFTRRSKAIRSSKNTGTVRNPLNRSSL